MPPVSRNMDPTFCPCWMHPDKAIGFFVRKGYVFLQNREERVIMTATMDRVFKEALELPLDQRLTVVYRILEQSDDGLSSEEAERKWDGVIRERMARYDCGKAKTRPASEVFAALEKRLGE